MYQVKRRKSGTFYSGNQTFKYNEWQNVTKTFFDYLKNNFVDDFEFKEAEKKKTVVTKEVKESRKTKGK